MGEVIQPTLHKPVPMNARVVVPVSAGLYHQPLTGKVIGICSYHVIFIYIVLLDTPINNGYGEMSAVPVPGSLLESPDGSNWRLDG